MTSEKRSKSVERHKGARAQPVSIAPPTANGGAAQWPDKAAWHEHASFQVTFYSRSDADGRSAWQTRAYHDETGGEATWPEVTGEQLVRWMSEQAALPPAAKTEPMPTVDVSATAAEAASPMVDLQLSLGEWSLDEVLAEQQLGHPQVARHLRASIAFQLSGVRACSVAAAGSRYAAQLSAYDVDTGATSLLGTAQHQLQPELLDYLAEIAFDIPDVGRYQLIGTIVIVGNNLAETALGPVLTVVP